MIVCLICGQANQQGSSQCSGCGAALPKIMQPTESHGFQKRVGRFNQFKNAAEKAKSGEWSRSEFGEWLSNMSQVLAEKAQELIELYQESGYYEYGPDEVEIGLTGIQEYEQAMEVMWAYVEDGELYHIDEGLELMWEGNEKINEAMRLNREFRRQLEDEYGYM